MRENFWVYMVTNKTQTVLYTGVTNDLERRVLEHRNKTNPRSFASKYSAHILVWYEHFPTAAEAIAAETYIKRPDPGKETGDDPKDESAMVRLERRVV